MSNLKVALIGNPNCGKTTLFNCLTGANSKIGNWPGVTIEKKSGIIKYTDFELVDLPGIYSLSPYSPEEEISRNYIFNEKPDVIINIVDATTLERGLYLTTQLLDLDSKVIIALNMCDILEKNGISINIQKLESIIGRKIIKISALKETGIKDLISEITEPSFNTVPSPFDTYIENSIKQIQRNLNDTVIHKRFVSLKLLEKDPKFKYYSNDILNIISNTEKNYNKDLEEIIATQRYNFVDYIFNLCVISKIKKTTLSDKIDKILLNKWISFPSFCIIMFLIYYFSVGIIGTWSVDFVTNIINTICNLTKNILNSLHFQNWFVSLIVDGILVGVGAVLKFIPQLIILFLCISILETCGYMPRIALLLDKFFRKIGLNGKSLIPFIIGSGCSVPGILSSKIIENNNERKLTALLTPFIPCSAKLPIIVLFSSCFFPMHSGLIAASLYFLAIMIIIFSAFILNKTIFKNDSNTYFLELPEYKIPDFKYVFKDVFSKVYAFIKRASSTILLSSIIIWYLLSFSISLDYSTNISNSILAFIGKKISWIMTPFLGINSWESTICAIQGIIAKEQVVSCMNIINGFSINIENSYNIFSNNSTFSFFTPASAYAFMVFNLFSSPCIGAIAVMKKELGNIKNTVLALLFQTGLAYILSCVCFFIGTNFKNIRISNLYIYLFIILFVSVFIKSNFMNKNIGCTNCYFNNNCSK